MRDYCISIGDEKEAMSYVDLQLLKAKKNGFEPIGERSIYKIKSGENAGKVIVWQMVKKD